MSVLPSPPICPLRTRSNPRESVRHTRAYSSFSASIALILIPNRSRQSQYHTPPPVPQTNPNFLPNLAAPTTPAPSFAPYNPYPGYPPAPQMAVPSAMQPSAYNPYSVPQSYPVSQGYATQSYAPHAPQSYPSQSFPAQPARWATSEDQMGREFR